MPRRRGERSTDQATLAKIRSSCRTLDEATVIVCTFYNIGRPIGCLLRRGFKVQIVKFIPFKSVNSFIHFLLIPFRLLVQFEQRIDFAVLTTMSPLPPLSLSPSLLFLVRVCEYFVRRDSVKKVMIWELNLRNSFIVAQISSRERYPLRRMIGLMASAKIAL